MQASAQFATFLDLWPISQLIIFPLTTTQSRTWHPPPLPPVVCQRMRAWVYFCMRGALSCFPAVFCVDFPKTWAVWAVVLVLIIIILKRKRKERRSTAHAAHVFDKSTQRRPMEPGERSRWMHSCIDTGEGIHACMHAGLHYRKVRQELF